MFRLWEPRRRTNPVRRQVRFLQGAPKSPPRVIGRRKCKRVATSTGDVKSMMLPMGAGHQNVSRYRRIGADGVTGEGKHLHKMLL